jgi:hypothetical protein
MNDYSMNYESLPENLSSFSPINESEDSPKLGSIDSAINPEKEKIETNETSFEVANTFADLPNEVQAVKEETPISINISVPLEKKEPDSTLNSTNSTNSINLTKDFQNSIISKYLSTALSLANNDFNESNNALNNTFSNIFLKNSQPFSTQTNVISSSSPLDIPSSKNNLSTSSTINSGSNINTNVSTAVSEGVSSTSNTLNTAVSSNPSGNIFSNVSQSAINKYLGGALKIAADAKPGETSATSSEMGVAKTSPTFNEKIPQSTEKIIEKTNSNLTKISSASSESTLTQQEKSIAGESSQTSQKSESISVSEVGKSVEPAAADIRLVGLDGLEARLARLEYLLSNPLEVKITH